MVVPRPMPAAPRRFLVVAALRLPAVAVCHGSQAAACGAVPWASQIFDRYAEATSRGLPAAPFLVLRRYLIVVPRLLPAARSLLVART
jgi:hypothetical protein